MQVYIAGPLTRGNQIENVRSACQLAARLAQAGHVPYCPHLSWFMELMTPLGWDAWMRIDLAWLSKCDCLIRIPGESRGAEMEVAHARAHEIDVYESEESFWRNHPCTLLDRA